MRGTLRDFECLFFGFMLDSNIMCTGRIRSKLCFKGFGNQIVLVACLVNERDRTVNSMHSSMEKYNRSVSRKEFCNSSAQFVQPLRTTVCTRLIFNVAAFIATMHYWTDNTAISFDVYFDADSFAFWASFVRQCRFATMTDIDGHLLG